MTQGPIENPIINSPYTEPQRHFTTSADGDVTGEMEPRGIILARRGVCQATGTDG